MNGAEACKPSDMLEAVCFHQNKSSFHYAKLHILLVCGF